MNTMRRLMPFKATNEGVRRIGKAPKQAMYSQSSKAGKMLSKLGEKMETKRMQDFAKPKYHRGTLKSQATRAFGGRK